MDRYSTTEWLRIATAGIVSPKERAAAKQELEDHIVDHMDALLAAGLSPEDAKNKPFQPWVTRKSPPSCCERFTNRF